MNTKLIITQVEDKYIDIKDRLDKYICVWLHNFIVKNKIQTVIETGISKGFSSLYILDALEITNGKLYSIEYNLLPEEQIVVPKEYYKRWERFQGKSTDVLQTVFDLTGKIDLFWHDSDHCQKNQLFEYNLAKKYSTYIGSHDIHRRNTKAWDLFINNRDVKIIYEDDIFGMLKVIGG